ncbi:MAG: hypothetical protein A2591_04165 [Candidatus Yonathbacteria bacterium RIFOXYD1_FULL_52_36]|uniref:HIT domain-containing protein n=1 Tax=Candidatus Yonathbacteria bacterium RIFOXYD1_FULL_52_36 TaxID=1802730 RepID=A0A1G2SHM8_9BACT|nr:MAG: hypothetical protein A2591_04165 [Candidatus Yonathbacteria bacterium RIFOXYD1_FULL_52_36]
MTEKNQLVNLSHTRGDEQTNVYHRIAEGGFCPFCWENFQKNHKKPLLIQTEWWIATENQWPYQGSTLHMLFVYRDHVDDPTKVAPDAWSEFYQHILPAIMKRYHINGGGIYMRFGNTNITGSSVAHFHANLIVGGEMIEQPTSEDWLTVALGYKHKEA